VAVLLTVILTAVEIERGAVGGLLSLLLRLVPDQLITASKTGLDVQRGVCFVVGSVEVEVEAV
jgi:hypothetical protein